ncbi:hypothetical protein T11_4876 [Trichinella zimbabwensis]|uniref:Uncharacterized protein n=1 Tax=Trichinella zimbabwensis TaxID=268475 RepID=A0A0V1HX87_9BILA|nr:hypothetical protein T11_4876 [Trichinella zimbabwensis]
MKRWRLLRIVSSASDIIAEVGLWLLENLIENCNFALSAAKLNLAEEHYDCLANYGEALTTYKCYSFIGGINYSNYPSLCFAVKIHKIKLRKKLQRMQRIQREILFFNTLVSFTLFTLTDSRSDAFHLYV